MTNWGIIGCGAIAPAFAEGLDALPDAKLYAVASKNKERAENLASTFDVNKIYTDYGSLVKDPKIDIIYIATTHNFHKENALLCLRNKKAVLCEKPLAINAKEAKQMVGFARKQKVFLMEAMWTRFFPLMVKLREWVNKGIIGKIKLIKADFGFRSDWGTVRRIFNKSLAGGALLDVGIYPISFASMIMGKQPVKIASASHLGDTGVDEVSAYLFKYEQDEIALLSSAITLETPHDAILIGDKGSIRIPDFWHPNKMIVTNDNKIEETYHFHFESNGYNYEAMEVMECLKRGKQESEIMPLNETIDILETMDKIRAQWNLIYPGE